MQEEAASRRIGDLDKIRGAIEEECEEETIVYKSRELVKIRASNEYSKSSNHLSKISERNSSMNRIRYKL